MQTVTNLLVNNGLLFTKFENVPLKALGSRKQLTCYFGINSKREFSVVFVNFSKTRLLRKELLVMEDLVVKLEIIKSCKIKSKVLFLKTDICSKALVDFKKSRWRVINVPL